MPLKVIGAGLGRTGTHSLKLALEQLGFGPCYHMTEVFARPQAPGEWLAAGKREGVDWEQVFGGYQSTVDWPSAAFYKELAVAYPDAKVILNLRDAESWFRSTQNTIFADPTFSTGPPIWREMVDVVITQPMGGRLDDREALIARFSAHNEEVKRIVPKDRLLVFEAEQGWAPLCSFLGAPVPATPYPKSNTTEDWLARSQGRPPPVLTR